MPGASGARLVLDRYRLERRLGAGGYGVVWLAWDERLEREVAVKVIPREGSDRALWSAESGAPPRAEREARAAARLNHPGIVALYELAADEQDVYLVSELVRGRTMAELMRAGAVSDRDAARIGAALCEALDHAHERGVIHRDMKPQNVMVVAEPAAGAGFAKLADFGVAHVASGDPLTRTGDVVGTLAYMAPEQAEGERVTPASDVYSLALTLYEAWTGTNPIRAGGPAATVRRLGRPLPSLASMRRDLPPELCDAIDDALEPDPALRPGAVELRDVLRRAEKQLDDQGGLVEPETLARVGLTSAMPRRGLLGRRRPAEVPAQARGRRVLERAGAGVAAGLLLLLALTQLGPEPPFSPLAAAAAAAVVTALLPRLGWLLTAAAACAWLASPDADRQGTALVLAAGAAPVPFLLPRAGLLWSVPVLAPLLGAIALAPAFVGIAALASGAWRRAGLAAAGFIWLALAEPLTGHSLLFGVADGTQPAAEWQDSVSRAATDVLSPLASSPALAPAVVWAAFAVVLPLVVRGRFLVLDVLGAGLWAAGLIAAHVALGDLLAATTDLEQARGMVAGAVLGAIVAVAASTVGPPAETWRAEPVTTP
jgi:hypothetical protein